MDQVTIADSEGQVGIGDVKYAIVISKLRYEALDHDYWTFLPLRSLESPETDVHFQQFYRNVFRDGTQPIVYCDAHKSLIKACDNNAIVCSHPPPGRPQANSIIERKIGIALGGIRSYLVTAGLPNCFWPFAGHCFSLNHCLIHGSYQQAMDHDIVDMFVTGQLVFFKPAPTIDKQSKVEPTLRPGIFLDYYMDYKGLFSGQYIVADLDDFAGKNLFLRIGRHQFKGIHLHRTEVCREPPGATDPILSLIHI